MSIYCGNNRNNPDLVSGRKRLGTRYECFRKGVGVGRNLPYDKAYSTPYIPIDDFKVYCGKKTRLPPGYDRMGSASQCLHKGIGVGKSLRAKKRRVRRKKRKKSR